MHWGFYLGSCWWISWLPLASRGPACERKRALWLYAVYKYLTAFTPLFRIPLTQWTLHYSKATFDIFHSSSQGYLLWATASLLCEGQGNRKDKALRATQNCLSARILHSGFIWIGMCVYRPGKYFIIWACVHACLCVHVYVCEDLCTHMYRCMWAKARGQTLMFFSCSLHFCVDRVSHWLGIVLGCSILAPRVHLCLPA